MKRFSKQNLPVSLLLSTKASRNIISPFGWMFWCTKRNGGIAARGKFAKEKKNSNDSTCQEHAEANR